MNEGHAIVIPPDIDARIREVAGQRRMSEDEWILHAIERALREERTPLDPLVELSSLGAPTADVEQMLAEIDAGRG